VENVATPFKTSDASSASARHFPAQLALDFMFLAALWFILCRQLSGEWSVNEQYNSGWFVPFLPCIFFGSAGKTGLNR